MSFSRFAWVFPPLLVVTIGCGITVSRNLGKATLNAAIYDDVCGLQDYFDRLAMGALRAPAIVGTQEMEKTEGKRASGGRTRFAFTTDGQLGVVRRVLGANYRRLPEELGTATEVDLTVRWSERADNRFVVMTEDAELTVGKESYTLPYHHCLSALLFGDSLYKSRRVMLDLPAMPPPPSPPDAGPDVQPDTGAAPASAP
jgi:hypothetical protein